MNSFLYGMWCMWLIVLLMAQNGPMQWKSLVVMGLIIPGLLVMVGRGVALLVKWGAFKWERRV